MAANLTFCPASTLYNWREGKLVFGFLACRIIGYGLTPLAQEVLGIPVSAWDDCPAVLLSLGEHWFPDGIHAFLSQAKIPFRPGKLNYTKEEVFTGLERAYDSAGKPELWEIAKQWLATKGIQ